MGNAFRKIYEKISYAKCATYPGCTGYQANRKAGFPVWPEIGYPAGFLDIFFAYNKVFLAGYRIFDQIPDIWPYVNCLPKLTDLYLQHRFWCVVSYRCGPPAENRSRYAPRPPPPPCPTEILFTIITYQRRLLFDLLSSSIKLYDPLYFHWLD